MTARFFVREGIPRAAVGDGLELPERVVHHAIRVLRLGVGAPITLFDGTGGEYRATIVDVGKRGAHARIDAFDPVDRESLVTITLALAIVAADAMDRAVRSAVELGVSAIAPLTTARSAPPGAIERVERRRAHWQEIAVAACEQCGRNRVPPVHAPVALGDYSPGGDLWIVCVPGQATSRPPPRAGSYAICIGPEGGLTEEEIEHALARGAVALSMGPRILRADTASTVAMALMQSQWGDVDGFRPRVTP